MSDYAKPIPTPSEDSRPYWEATKNHELKLQQCRECNAFRFPPAEVCSECTSDAYDWKPVSGKAGCSPSSSITAPTTPASRTRSPTW